MANSINLLFFDFLNKLVSFPKLAKNSITLIISDIFVFRAIYAISKSAT